MEHLRHVVDTISYHCFTLNAAFLDFIFLFYFIHLLQTEIIGSNLPPISGPVRFHCQKMSRKDHFRPIAPWTICSNFSWRSTVHQNHQTFHRPSRSYICHIVSVDNPCAIYTALSIYISSSSSLSNIKLSTLYILCVHACTVLNHCVYKVIYCINHSVLIPALFALLRAYCFYNLQKHSDLHVDVHCCFLHTFGHLILFALQLNVYVYPPLFNFGCLCFCLFCLFLFTSKLFYVEVHRE